MQNKTTLMDLLTGVIITWLAWEYDDDTFGFQLGFWLPADENHWLVAIFSQGDEPDLELTAAVDGRPKDLIVQTIRESLEGLHFTEGQWMGIDQIDGYPSDARSTMQLLGIV